MTAADQVVPERCPACGAAPIEDNTNHRFFDCGACWSKHLHRFYAGCRTALVLVPELVAALKRLVSELPEVSMSTRFSMAVAIEKAEAAIAKATGGITVAEELERR